MNLLDNENEWSKSFDVKCSRPRKSEGARYMSDDQRLENPQAFVCMLCPRDKRRCCNSAGALVSHQHRSHGYKNPSDAPLLMTRALRAVRRMVLVQKRWITSLTEQSSADKFS